MSRCGDGQRPGCGREIAWGVLPNGVRVPLDPLPPVYLVGPWDPKEQAFRIERASIGYRVSHFSVCPKASNFSHSAKRPPRDQQGGST